MSHWRRSEWEPVDYDDAKLAVRGTDNWEASLDHDLEMILPHLEGPRILDYGCGVGRLTKPVAMRHPEWQVFGYDTSAKMIEYATIHNHLLNVRYLTWQPTDITTMFSMLVFQHLPDREVRDLLAARPAERLRFQFVTEGQPGPLNHPRQPSRVEAWLHAAGYTDLLFESDPQYPEWRWVTAL